jgi:hypothetical protein
VRRNPLQLARCVQQNTAGDETDRLHRWGYRFYRELFNDRQLLGLELSCRHIAAVKDKRIKHALATNLSDLLRYQNTLCRYDTMALKSLPVNTKYRLLISPSFGSILISILIGAQAAAVRHKKSRACASSRQSTGRIA